MPTNDDPVARRWYGEPGNDNSATAPFVDDADWLHVPGSGPKCAGTWIKLSPERAAQLREQAGNG